MDQGPEHQEAIQQATVQLSKGQHAKVLNIQTSLPIQHKKTDSIKERCKAIETGGNRGWKLGVQESEDSEIEEVVLRIQGIVCNRELPPILKPFKV